MRNMGSILFFENKKRLQKLNEYYLYVKNYFDNTKVDMFMSGRLENATTNDLRRLIKENSYLINQIIYASGISPIATRYPAPALGGFVTNFNLIENIFQLTSYQVSHDVVLDLISTSIGAYKSNIHQSIIRMINPFYYVSEILYSFNKFILYPFKSVLSEKPKNILMHILKLVEYAFLIYQLYALFWTKFLLLIVKIFN